MKSSVKIGLVGYGKMGRAVETVAEKQGLQIGTVISSKDNRDGNGIRALGKDDADVLLDFTVPGAVLTNITAAAECGINIVVGTTGWYDDLHNAEAVVKKNNTGLFYASNFSVGMNMMFQLVRDAVRLANRFAEYDVYVHELHHNQKKDSPSGSAYSLAQIIINESAHKKRMDPERLNERIDPATLHVSSTRAGSIIGTHLVGFDSDFDSLEIKHSAKNRMGFVQGALRAAEWMKGRTGVFTMEDLLRV